MSTVAPHILIAEDDKDSRFLLRRIIKKEMPAALVSEASDGETALSIFKEKNADLVLVDHKIPMMSGLDLIDQIRLKNADVPIVLISNSPNAELEAPGHGISHFLNKANLLRDLPPFLSALIKAEG